MPSMVLWLSPKILLIYLFCTYVWHSVCDGVGMVELEDNFRSPFSLSPMWFAGIELRPADLAASTFTH